MLYCILVFIYFYEFFLIVLFKINVWCWLVFEEVVRGGVRGGMFEERVKGGEIFGE